MVSSILIFPEKYQMLEMILSKDHKDLSKRDFIQKKNPKKPQRTVA